MSLSKTRKHLESPEPDLRGPGVDLRTNRSGSVRCSSIGAKLGFQPGSVPCAVNGQVVSSTLIRSAVECGDLESAASFWADPFTILGTVSEGRQLGRRLGFPTANLHAHNERFTKWGLRRSLVSRKRYGGVVNSIRPTVEGKRERGFSGFAIFDFDEEIYGQDIEVAFLDYLRPEQKFSGIEELQSQIERDAARLARSTRLDSREQ